MSSNDNIFDNSLESAVNMSQEEIEKLLNEQQEMMQENKQGNSFGFDDADLASLLSELEATDDGDIQEISDLLDKAEKNEAADEGIVELMNKQEAEGDIPDYDVADLFSGEEATGKKLGLIQRIIAKFKKPAKEQEKKAVVEVSEEKDTFPDEILSIDVSEEEETAKEKPVKEKKVKEKKVKEKKPKKSKEVKVGTQPQVEADVMQDSEGVLNGSDAIIQELERQETAKQEEKDKKKAKKDKKSKNKKGKKGKKGEGASEGSEEDIPEKGKKKKEKKVKEKKVKEKKIKEKPVEAIDLLEADTEEAEPLSKKKVGLIFFVCIMLMLAIMAIIYNYSGHANKKLAQEAYEQNDYLQCYQLLYGQHLNESQEVMFHKSELTLKMDMFWNRYNAFEAEGKLLESLDKLIQFVFEYPQLSEYAAEWNCENIVADTYSNVLDVLSEDYKLDEQDAKDIANIEKDVDYTRKLTELVDKKQQGKLKYPDMLPEEEERIEVTGQ